MHNKITTEMSICQAENGFPLDELVKKLQMEQAGEGTA